MLQSVGAGPGSSRGWELCGMLDIGARQASDGLSEARGSG